MQEFRFHMALTGPLAADLRGQTEAALKPLLSRALPQPFALDSLTLAGKDSDGRILGLRRFAFTGS